MGREPGESEPDGSARAAIAHACDIYFDMFYINKGIV